MIWETILRLFQAMELELIEALAAALAWLPGGEAKKVSSWRSWRAEKLRESRRYRVQNASIVVRKEADIARATRAMLLDQHRQGYEAVAQEAARLNILPTAPPNSSFPPGKIDALVDDVLRGEARAEVSSLRMMDDVYRQTVQQASLSMARGGKTLYKSVDDATRGFLEQGITSIEYSDGRHVNISSYAEMALRTASTRARLIGEAAKRKEFGVDTVLVSQYGACSPTCLPYQGRVYIDDVWGDFDGEVHNGAGKSRNGRWYPLLSIAIRGGLFHPNCRHTLTTWYEGISRMPTPMDSETINNNYALEQQQRALERDVRKWARMEAGTLEPSLRKRYARNRQAAQQRLRTFVGENSEVLRRDPWREQARGVAYSQAQREAIARAGIRGTIHYPPRPIDIDSLAFNAKHVNIERDRSIDEREAKRFITSARASVSRWAGRTENYYSDDGVAYVDTQNMTIRTAYRAEDFTDDTHHILEVAKEFERRE